MLKYNKKIKISHITFVINSAFNKNEALFCVLFIWAYYMLNKNWFCCEILL